jgi:uncharacterized damage-inducible protein DinB
MNSPVLLTLLQYKAWADQELMQCLCDQQALLPPAVLQKCVRLMNHIHVVDRIFVAHLSGQPHPYGNTNTEATPTPEALCWDMQETNQNLLQSLSQTSRAEADAGLKFRFTDGDQGCMSPTEMLLHLGVHSTYHRGQVSQMLKEAGLAPPRDLLTRQLHTQEPERRKG